MNAGGLWPSGGRSASILDPNAGIDGGFLVNAWVPGRSPDRKALDYSSVAARPATTGRPKRQPCSVSKPIFDGSTVSKSFNNVGAAFIDPFVARNLRERFL